MSHSTDNPGASPSMEQAILAAENDDLDDESRDNSFVQIGAQDGAKRTNLVELMNYRKLAVDAVIEAWKAAKNPHCDVQSAAEVTAIIEESWEDESHDVRCDLVSEFRPRASIKQVIWRTCDKFYKDLVDKEGNLPLPIEPTSAPFDSEHRELFLEIWPSKPEYSSEAKRIAKKLELPEKFVQEAIDARPNQSTMSHHELVALLDYRRSGWDKEQHNIDLLDNCPELHHAMSSMTDDEKELNFRLWQACVSQHGETPDFIFSDCIRLASRGSTPNVPGLDNNVPYPGPPMDTVEDLIVLINNPFFQSIDTLRSVLAFAVACRTADGVGFPYKFKRVSSCILEVFGGTDEAEPVWKRFTTVRNECGWDITCMYTSVLEEIILMTNPWAKGESYSSQAPSHYVVKHQDVINVLQAIDELGSGDAKVFLPTRVASSLAIVSRNEASSSHEEQMEKLRRKSLLRQMYLNSLAEKGEPEVFDEGHERDSQNMRGQEQHDV